jgi:hypothetical protein
LKKRVKSKRASKEQEQTKQSSPRGSEVVDFENPLFRLLRLALRGRKPQHASIVHLKPANIQVKMPSSTHSSSCGYPSLAQYQSRERSSLASSLRLFDPVLDLAHALGKEEAG